MLLTGGVFALKHWRAKVDAERDYFGWGANLMFTVGFLAFFAMPFIGWGYARVIQANAPVAFHAIMGGHTGPHFTIQMGFVTALVGLDAAYFFARYRARAALGAVSLGMAALLLLLLNHPPLAWVPGGKSGWQAASAAGLLGFVAVLWLAGRRLQPAAVGAWRWALFSAGMAAFCAFWVGGFVRERSKSPDTVYGEIVKPEVLDWEADRFLFFTRSSEARGTKTSSFLPTGGIDSAGQRPLFRLLRFAARAPPWAAESHVPSGMPFRVRPREGPNAVPASDTLDSPVQALYAIARKRRSDGQLTIGT